MFNTYTVLTAKIADGRKTQRMERKDDFTLSFSTPLEMTKLSVLSGKGTKCRSNLYVDLLKIYQLSKRLFIE